MSVSVGGYVSVRVRAHLCVCVVSGISVRGCGVGYVCVGVRD